MLKYIGSIEKVLEIGSFTGDFAVDINKICSPKTLVLIDPWKDKICSGDQNGANMRCISGKTALNLVRNKLPHPICIQWKSSTFFTYSQTFFDGFFDFIYIDGDHSYEGCKHDLINAYRMVKPGGFLGGHDYSLNMENIIKYKGNPAYYKNFGVKRAVDEFLLENNKSMYGLALDGYTSFLIKK